MPNITQADREAAKELMYRKWYGLSDAAYEEMFCQAFAAHRTAAVANFIAELAPLLGAMEEDLTTIESPTAYTMKKVRELLVAVAKNSESTPAPLTADAVKRMMPAQGPIMDGNSLAFYKSPLGLGISWTDHRGEFTLKIGQQVVPLEAIGTVPAFAKLVEALGVTAEVGHG